MFRSLVSALAFVAAASAFAIPTENSVAPRDEVPSDETFAPPPTLLPINLDAFHTAVGIQPRAARDLTRMDPRKKASLVYGTVPKKDGSIQIANMTLYAPEEKLIVQMEAFEGMTTDVDCAGHDGELSITFTDKETFEYAVNKWSYLNEDADQEFIIIANHDGCGPENERQAYIVSEVDNDEEKFTTYLKSTPTEWKDVIGSYDLDFGSAVVSPEASAALHKRGICWVIFGCVDGEAAVRFPVGIGASYTPYPIYSASLLSVTCSNCYIGGTFLVSGRVLVRNYKIEEFSLGVSPEEFGAALEVTTRIQYAYSAGKTYSRTWKKTLIEAPIPGAGFSIPGVFTLGGVVGIDAGITMSFTSEVAFTIGVKASVPNSAKLWINLLDLTSSTATSWKPTVTPVVRLDAFNIGFTGAIYLLPNVAFKAQLTGVGNIKAAVNIEVPRVNIAASVTYSASGICPNAGAAKPFGVRLNLTGKLGLGLSIDAQVGTFFDDKLVDLPSLVAINIFSHSSCHAFAIIPSGSVQMCAA